MHRYTDEEKEFLKVNVKGITSSQLTDKFNTNFGTDLNKTQIRAFMKNNKLTNGINTQFSKGSIPYNKGKKGLTGANRTSFKKGNRPSNHRPIGSERISKDGYIEVKIQDGKLNDNWRPKHIVIWEKEHGILPEGHVVVFADKNKQNFDLSNLILVSRQQLLILNRNKLIYENAELTKTGIKVADLQVNINKRIKELSSN